MANQVLYGFHELQDIFPERVNATNMPLVSRAIDQAVEEHNRQLDTLMSLFVAPVEEPTARFQLGTNHRLQPLDDNGRARPVKPRGFYDVGFPLQEAGSAWAANYVTRIKMTVEEAHRVTQSMVIADTRWMRDHVLASIFASAEWTYPDERYGNIKVQPLASGDAVQYLMLTGADQAATDNHLMGQVAAIADATNPFPNIKKELTEHPENGGIVLSLVPTNLVSSINALDSFVTKQHPNINPALGSRTLVSDTPGIAVPGEVKGMEDSGVWVAEWPNLPDNYIISLTTEGVRPIGQRQDKEAELQGFKKVAERNDHPFYESQFLRRAGFGAFNRVAAHVTRIGNASYATPANYASPMP